MIALLRHPACVPSLFSGGAERERPRPTRAREVRRLLLQARLLAAAAACAVAMLIDLPLIRNTAVATGRALVG